MNATTCSYNAIFGEFNSQGIFIDMENNSEDWNVFSTSVHESTHSFIEFDSYLGQLEFLMQQIILSPQTDINTRERFKSFIEIIFDNSINVQESVAVFWELSFLESYNAELMDKEWELYKTKRPDYYIKYHFKDLEDFLDDAFDRYKFKPTEEQIKNKAENILLLAKYCMNIDITKLNFMGTSALSSITKDKPSFNPNYRFDKTIKYIKDNKISIYDLSKSVIEQIFDKLNFPYLHAFEVDFMSNWANNNLLSQYNLNNYSYYVAYEKIENPLEYILSINCYISERKYLGKIVSNPSETDIANAAFYAYVCDNNDSPTPTALINVRNGEIIDEFSTFVNPEKSIPKNVQELTHITDDMVKDAPTIEEILPKFLEFTKDTILVAHNAKFDISFISHFAKELKLEFKPKVMDTLVIARELYTSVENHKLGTLAEFLGITLEGAHRAINDTRATAKVFLRMLEDAKKKGINELGYMYSEIEEDSKKLPYYHIIILAKNYVGLKNLYRLISYSHVTYFNKRPRIPRSLLNRYKEGLIIGSACERGELYQSIFENQDEEKIENIAKYYDYLEIQPLGNNQFYIDQGKLKSQEDLININKKIVELGEKLNIPVVGTCDVHFLNPEDEIYRRIIMAGQGFSDADKQAPLYLRTTEEMLKEFEYLSPEKAYEIVVTNTNKVADLCDRISPISDEKCPPHIDGCEDTIKDIAMTRAHELYGENLPEIVSERLEKELDSIIKNGFSVMYIIAQKLVWKSNEDGYLVGSRGSVGSSFVANMTGITEVNSLKPHYRCPNCKYSEFLDYGVKNGFDLPDKDCPKCGHRLDKDGMDIPFETFLGFNGDKEPDIDLNFSGEYQAKAHRYTEVIFGKGTTFKAGTIGTIADKTAYGFVLKYLEERNKTMLSPEINRIAQGCTGIKRTSGQHPGGIIVVPKGREIYEFCPVQHPADDPHSDIVTTHFDYHSIDKNLLKLDILGHDDPTVIRMLQDITGIDPKKIPLDDKETMSIFSSTEALKVTKEQINSEVGTFGIPEFGTKFVRGMLVDTKPTTFEELIRISGLSHGTDVWLNNAQTLIEDGICTLSDAICTRDDIMIYLIDKGLPPNPSFKIMESVRKGKGLSEEQEALMREHDVPDWYIDSCKKIKYMFPKAHAAAYVTMAFRIAWFKVHIPKAYYAAFFSIRADDFDSDFMLRGKDVVKSKMMEIDNLGNNAGNKEKNMYPILEIVLEMYERNIEFLPVDIYKSDATKFLVEKDGIRPPLSSLTGFGEVDANKLVEARKEEKFTSIEQMAGKARIGKVAVETLQKAGCLNGMPRSEQLDMFDLL